MVCYEAGGGGGGVHVCNYSGPYRAVYSIITYNGAGKSVFLLTACLKK